MTSDAPVCARTRAISSTLPEPAKRRGSGRSRRPSITPSTRTPALVASDASSARLSAWSSAPKSSETSTAPSDAAPVARSARGKDAPAATTSGTSGVAAVVQVEIDRTRGDHGGDGVLVHHLSHGVLEQDDVLVEGLDLALELDPVDEIDRYGNVLFAQRVEEGIL